MDNDLISREALKKALHNFFDGKVIDEPTYILRDVFCYIDNAPTVDIVSPTINVNIPEKTKQEIIEELQKPQKLFVLPESEVEYPFYQEAYQTGYEEGKEDVIHSIAKQYSAHNELVPIWLSIGDMKGGAE